MEEILDYHTVQPVKKAELIVIPNSPRQNRNIDDPTLFKQRRHLYSTKADQMDNIIKLNPPSERKTDNVAPNPEQFEIYETFADIK